MELLKPNRSVLGSGPGPGASLCRSGGPLLNGSGTGNLSCEPPRIRGAGTRGGCLPKPPPRAPSHCTPQHSQRPPIASSKGANRQGDGIIYQYTHSSQPLLNRRACIPQYGPVDCWLPV